MIHLLATGYTILEPPSTYTIYNGVYRLSNKSHWLSIDRLRLIDKNLLWFWLGDWFRCRLRFLRDFRNALNLSRIVKMFYFKIERTVTRAPRSKITPTTILTILALLLM